MSSLEQLPDSDTVHYKYYRKRTDYDVIVGAIDMEEEWKSVYQEQSVRMEKAASGLGSTVGSNLSVDPLPYLRLMLELLQSHHDSLYAIREQLSELANSVTAIENRLEVLEEEGTPRAND